MTMIKAAEAALISAANNPIKKTLATIEASIREAAQAGRRNLTISMPKDPKTVEKVLKDLGYAVHLMYDPGGRDEDYMKVFW